MHAHTDTHTFIEIICEDKSGPEIVIQPVWGFQNDWDQYDTGLSFGIHTDKNISAQLINSFPIKFYSYNSFKNIFYEFMFLVCIRHAHPNGSDTIH